MPEQYRPERLPGARGGIVVIEGETTIKNDNNSANESRGETGRIYACVGGLAEG